MNVLTTGLSLHCTWELNNILLSIIKIYISCVVAPSWVESVLWSTALYYSNWLFPRKKIYVVLRCGIYGYHGKVSYLCSIRFRLIMKLTLRFLKWSQLKTIINFEIHEKFIIPQKSTILFSIWQKLIITSSVNSISWNLKIVTMW